MMNSAARMSTYSSRIQLPTDTPPQLIPCTKLPAKLSRLGCSQFDVSIDIGCAPLSNCESSVDMPPFADSRCRKPPPKPLPLPPPMSNAGVGRVPFPVVA